MDRMSSGLFGRVFSIGGDLFDRMINFALLSSYRSHSYSIWLSSSSIFAPILVLRQERILSSLGVYRPRSISRSCALILS